MADDENDALDNWEEQADSGVLDRRLEEMAIDLQNKEVKKQTPTSAARDILLTDESGRTQYQPQVRILRRESNESPKAPHSHSNSHSPAYKTKQSKHGKSLQQREAEYAEARLRIFGTLEPEPEVADNTTNDAVNTELNSIRNQSPPQIMKPDPSSPHMTVLRQPRGPDGTNGFTKPDPT